MKLSELCYQQAVKIWNQCAAHPFVQGMANGSLPVKNFRSYLLEDYLYLKEYIKIYAVAITKSKDFNLIRFFSDNMQTTLDETFRVHVPLMKKLGIKEEEIAAASPHRNSLSYSHYMLTEAQAGDALDCLVMLLNCSWAYAHIAEKVVREKPGSLEHPLYGDWFRGYAYEEYQTANRKLIARVDGLAEEMSVVDERAKELCRLFRNCAEYEIGFWDIHCGREA